MTKEPSADVQEFARQLLLQPTPAGGRGRRSPLFWWMFNRADELKPIFERARTIWANVAAALPDTDDTKDGAGKRPTGERARKTWFEVCQAKGWMEKPAQPSRPAPTKDQQPPTPGDASADDEDVQLTAGDGTVLKSNQG
jgi:hypothetical protein